MNFAQPHVLWLLLLVPPTMLLFLWWATRRRQRLLEGFVQARLLPELTTGMSPAREGLRTWLLVFAATALIVALARPQWGFTWEEARQKGLDIVIAIDTSKSMLAEDIKPNRLTRAKLAAIDLMQTAKSDRLGLVAFAGGAFLQCPMTIDDAAFRQSVEMLDVNTLPQGGTAIAEAITTAEAAFKEGDSHRVLVLFTDGEDHDSNAVEAARKASDAGMRIFTVGIGSAEGELLQVRNSTGQLEYIKDDAGNVVKSRLNEQILQEIATAGNGFYLPMRGAKVIETLYEKGLAPLPKTESDAKLYKHYHEQFHWPLALAALLLVLEILLPARAREKSPKRQAKTSPQSAIVAMLILLLLPTLATASPSSAFREYEAGRFDKAQEEYQRLLQKKTDEPRLALNAGTAAYRGGKLDDAESLLSKAVTAPDLRVQQQAYYNRGNTRFENGEAAPELEAKKSAWEQSLKDFESAMKLDTNDADAKHNYEFVKKKLEELKQQEQQQKNQDQNEDQKQDDQKNQDQQQNQDKQDQQKSDEQKQQEQQNQQQQKDQSQQDQQKNQSQQQEQEKQQKDQKQDEQKQEQQQNPDDKKQSDEQPQASEAAARDQHQMTPEQAQRVLDTMKGEEKVLPVQLEKPPQSDRKLKDW